MADSEDFALPSIETDSSEPSSSCKTDKFLPLSSDDDPHFQYLNSTDIVDSHLSDAEKDHFLTHLTSLIEDFKAVSPYTYADFLIWVKWRDLTNSFHQRASNPREDWQLSLLEAEMDRLNIAREEHLTPEMREKIVEVVGEWQAEADLTQMFLRFIDGNRCQVSRQPEPETLLAPGERKTEAVMVKHVPW